MPRVGKKEGCEVGGAGVGKDINTKRMRKGKRCTVGGREKERKREKETEKKQ